MKDRLGRYYETTGEFRPPTLGEQYFSPEFGIVLRASGDWAESRVIVRPMEQGYGD